MNKFLICILFGVFASIANASYLYWTVDTDQLGKVNAYTESIGVEAWTTAKFYEVDGDGVKTEMEIASAANIDGEAGPVNVNLGDITSKEGYSYYIELVNSSSVLLGYQQGTYASIASQYLTDDLPSTLPAAVTWHGASSYNAPEPTSGLLMMLGAAMLGLRRKQRKTE